MAFLKAVQDKFKLENFLERYTEYINQTKLNILIIGGSGVGKSSTIKALLKDDTQESNTSPILEQAISPQLWKYKNTRLVRISPFMIAGLRRWGER